MKASILGLGTWLPAQVRRNEDWPAGFAAQAQASGDRTFNDIPPAVDELAVAILARDLALEQADPFLGARLRHVADPAQTAEEAEAEAARNALAQAQVDPRDIDLVLSYSVVPERVGLPTAGSVAHLIGAERALGLGIESACASALTQLQIACAHVEAGLARYVLLTQSHLLLRAFPMMHPAAPGLGDAASAMVVGTGPGLRVRSVCGATHGEFAYAVTWVRSQAERDAPWWCEGSDFRLSSKVPWQAKQLMRDTVTFGAETLGQAARMAGIAVGDLSVLATVQPRGFIPGAVAERLGLSRDCAVTTYEHIAHVGACGPVFNLGHASKSGRLTRGSKVGLYAQGASFTRAGAILEVTENCFQTEALA